MIQLRKQISFDNRAQLEKSVKKKNKTIKGGLIELAAGLICHLS